MSTWTVGRIRTVAWLTAVAALGAAALLVFGTPSGTRTVSTGAASVGGPFELTSETGERFSSESLAGRPFAIYFGFTHCPDICPASMFKMAELLEAMGEDARDFPVLFVTVDPERDTPELLSLYTDSFDERIVGLTGTDEEIAEVARAYRAYFRRVPTEGDGYTMDHTAAIYLMNADGSFYGLLSHDERPDAARETMARFLARNA